MRKKINGKVRTVFLKQRLMYCSNTNIIWKRFISHRFASSYTCTSWRNETNKRRFTLGAPRQSDESHIVWGSVWYANRYWYRESNRHLQSVQHNQVTHTHTRTLERETRQVTSEQWAEDDAAAAHSFTIARRREGARTPIDSLHPWKPYTTGNLPPMIKNYIHWFGDQEFLKRSFVKTKVSGPHRVRCLCHF